MSAASDTMSLIVDLTNEERVDDSSGNHDDGNISKEETIVPRLAPAERGVRVNETILQIQALGAELPAIVNQILEAHKQHEGYSTKRRHDTLRAEWEQALRAEMHNEQNRDHSMRVATVHGKGTDRYSS